MKKFILTALAVCGIITASAATPETKDAPQLPADIQALTIVAPLAQYGYANGDAMALIEAAQILVNTPSQVEAREKTTEGGGEGDQKADKPALTVDQLLADATEIAAGDAALLKLIADVKESQAGTTRGAVGGPKYNRDKVNAKGTDWYNVRFRGGETACVYVSGDGDTDLDLYIYDSNDNLITSDCDGTDECIVSFTPRWTGTFKIKIKNWGNVYNRYTLTTN